MSYQVKKKVPLSTLTTFKQEGEVDVVLECGTLEALKAAIRDYPNAEVIGKGSNVLIDEKKLKNPLLKITKEYKGITVQGSTLSAGAGVTVNQLMQALSEYGKRGLEFMAGVPASVGGMIAMNFGCWGIEIADCVREVTVLTRQLEVKSYSKEEMQFKYRSSRIHTEKSIVLSAVFQVETAEPLWIKEKITENINKRLSSQPLRGKTFGSTFKNPEGGHAGRYLEEAGFKGKPHQSVQFSEKHANFMINTGAGTFEMAEALIKEAQSAVKEKYNVNLELEVKIIK